MGPVGVIKSQILSVWLLTLLLLLLGLLNVLGSNRKPYAGSLESFSELPWHPLWVKLGSYKRRYFVRARLLSKLVPLRKTRCHHLEILLLDSNSKTLQLINLKLNRVVGHHLG